MTAVRELADAVYPGLDLSREIEAVQAQRAWQVLAGRGFRRDFQGVTMHRPNEAGYSTSDSYVIDDWR